MQTVRHGPPTPMESPQAHDEIGNLIDTYNYMTRKMEELMEKQAKAAEDLRIAEFNSLQAQINPHFLYNTMDMINWMALQGQTDEISHAVQSLSRFYKLTLSRKKGISTIARELEHVTIYVQLQNMRYHDSIELITDIPDELSEYQIPKLTLQPVVENSILHGILEKESKSGTIVITGRLEAGGDELIRRMKSAHRLDNDLYLGVVENNIKIFYKKLLIRVAREILAVENIFYLKLRLRALAHDAVVIFVDDFGNAASDNAVAHYRYIHDNCLPTVIDFYYFITNSPGDKAPKENFLTFL